MLLYFDIQKSRSRYLNLRPDYDSSINYVQSFKKFIPTKKGSTIFFLMIIQYTGLIEFKNLSEPTRKSALTNNILKKLPIYVFLSEIFIRL